MKAWKNKNGFTLIELLAVIVVLAIVTVLATTTLLPLMNVSIKKAFITEANAARDSASNVMALISNGFFESGETGKDYQNSETKTCISLKRMAEEGLYVKDMDFFEGNPAEYEGKVIVTKKDSASSNYKYKVIMHNDKYFVEKEGKVAEDDVNVKEYKAGDKDSSYFECSASDVSA